jgi:hypothetical protein
MIMNLKAPDNPLIIWLDVCGEIWLKVLNFNALEVRGNDIDKKVYARDGQV